MGGKSHYYTQGKSAAVTDSFVCYKQVDLGGTGDHLISQMTHEWQHCVVPLDYTNQSDGT